MEGRGVKGFTASEGYINSETKSCNIYCNVTVRCHCRHEKRDFKIFVMMKEMFFVYSSVPCDKRDQLA